MNFSISKSLKKWLLRSSLCLLVVACFSSCIPQRYIKLMQNKDNGPLVFDALDTITSKYLLQVNDYLYVSVTSPDPKLSQCFNPMQSMGTGSSNMSSKEFYYYLVDDNFDIELPVCGKINLKGCNLERARETIKKVLADYLTEFDVTVHLASNTFTVMGEFSSWGVKKMERPQITIYDAIASSGGFTPYARRDEIKLLRNDANGKAHIYTIDIADDNIINSEFYYIYPNDVLYARPMRIKSLGFTEVFSTGIISSVASLLTVTLLIINL